MGMPVTTTEQPQPQPTPPPGDIPTELYQYLTERYLLLNTRVTQGIARPGELDEAEKLAGFMRWMRGAIEYLQTRR